MLDLMLQLCCWATADVLGLIFGCSRAASQGLWQIWATTGLWTAICCAQQVSCHICAAGLLLGCSPAAALSPATGNLNVLLGTATTPPGVPSVDASPSPAPVHIKSPSPPGGTAPQASPANPVSALLGAASAPSGVSSLAVAPGEARSCLSAVIPVCLCCADSRG